VTSENSTTSKKRKARTTTQERNTSISTHYYNRKKMSFFWSDPWDELRRMQREMDRLTSAINQPQLTAGGEATNTGKTGTELATSGPATSLWRPLIDVKEGDKEITVHAEVPGLNKEDIHVEVKNNVLTVSGERKWEKKEENEKVHRVERSYGKFSRSLALPEGVDEKSIKAAFNNGVLELSIPKPEQKVTRTNLLISVAKL